MRIALTILQFSLLVPFIIGIIKYKDLGSFLRVIFYLISFSLVSELCGNISAEQFKTNLRVYQIYFLVSPILMYWAWSNVQTYNLKDIKRSRPFTIVCLLTLSGFIFFKPSVDNFIIFNLINVLLMLLFGMQYYIAKIMKKDISETLNESVFIVASAFILYGISVVIILSTYPFIPENAVDTIWFVKQIFYLIFNILIAYSFYLNKETAT